MDEMSMKQESAEIKELKRQIMSLRAQLEIERSRTANLSGGSLLNSEQIDLYPGEQLDLVLSILEQAKERCASDSRAYDILASLLTQNRKVGRGDEILRELTRIFKNGEPTTEADISDLRAIGFTYTQSRKHPKLRFHDRYLFVLPGSPSDSRRGGRNTLSGISKCIAVSQKI
jgi:hypothetical protein